MYSTPLVDLSFMINSNIHSSMAAARRGQKSWWAHRHTKNSQRCKQSESVQPSNPLPTAPSSQASPAPTQPPTHSSATITIPHSSHQKAHSSLPSLITVDFLSDRDNQASL